MKLISMEGFEFVIDREAAMVSQTIRSMLTSPGFFSSLVVGLVIVIPILILLDFDGFCEIESDLVVNFPQFERDLARDYAQSEIQLRNLNLPISIRKLVQCH